MPPASAELLVLIALDILVAAGIIWAASTLRSPKAPKRRKAGAAACLAGIGALFVACMVVSPALVLSAAALAALFLCAYALLALSSRMRR